MKRIMEISNFIKLFFIFLSLFSVCVNGGFSNINSYLNNDKFFIRDIDVNNDGILDKVVSNINGFGDELLFFLKDNKRYNLAFKGVNLSEDGGASISDVKGVNDDKFVMVIITSTDRLNVINNFYITYDKNKWFIGKIVSEYNDPLDDYTKRYYCEFNNLSFDLSSPELDSKLPNLYLSDEYIKTKCKLDFFFEKNIDEFIHRFDDNDINIVSGIERYKKFVNVYPYSKYTKNKYLIIINKLSKLNLEKEKRYLEKVVFDNGILSKIVLDKAYLYNSNSSKSNMYLIKGDKVTILDEKIDESGKKWYLINYKGKKDINMWLKSDAIDLN